MDTAGLVPFGKIQILQRCLTLPSHRAVAGHFLAAKQKPPLAQLVATMQVPNHQQQELSSAYHPTNSLAHCLSAKDWDQVTSKTYFDAKFLQPLHQGSQIGQHASAGARWRLANGFLALQDVTLRWRLGATKTWPWLWLTIRVCETQSAVAGSFLGPLVLSYTPISTLLSSLQLHLFWVKSQLLAIQSTLAKAKAWPTHWVKCLSWLCHWWDAAHIQSSRWANHCNLRSPQVLLNALRFCIFHRDIKINMLSPQTNLVSVAL